jgi:hypothetical protein
MGHAISDLSVGKLGGQLATLANKVVYEAGVAIWFGSPRFLKTVDSNKSIQSYGINYGGVMGNISILVAN